MSDDILNPSASVTIGIRGLAVLCHNKTFNNNRGRWEIAIPRFTDHTLSVEVTGVGNFFVEPKVKFIEIRDRASVATKPTNEVGDSPDRKNPEKQTNDFRWVTDFSNELPHKVLSAAKPQHLGVTMLYVYDAIAYTKSIDSSELIRPDQDDTGRVVNGAAKKLPDAEIIPFLEGSNDSLFEAGLTGMDIQSSGGDAVDILFDRANAITIPHGIKPQQILISNLEPADEKSDDRFVDSEKFHFGLGDLFRYYELFNVEGPRVHQWGRQAKEEQESGPNKNCCCNNTRVDLANLDAFL